MPTPDMVSSDETSDQKEVLIRNVGSGEAELTLDVVMPWPDVLAIMQALDPGSRESTA